MRARPLAWLEDDQMRGALESAVGAIARAEEHASGAVRLEALRRAELGFYCDRPAPLAARESASRLVSPLAMRRAL
jgi:hypothetical protein